MIRFPHVSSQLNERIWGWYEGVLKIDRRGEALQRCETLRVVRATCVNLGPARALESQTKQTRILSWFSTSDFCRSCHVRSAGVPWCWVTSQLRGSQLRFNPVSKEIQYLGRQDEETVHPLTTSY